VWDGSAARVVAAEDDDGVVVNTRFLDGVQNLTDVVVHLADEVGEQPPALGRLAHEIRVADHRGVDLGVAHVDDEGLLRRRVPLDVLDRLWDNVIRVEDRTHLEVKRHYRCRGLAFLSLPDHGRRHPALLEQRPGGICRPESASAQSANRHPRSSRSG
jgi:hypothetical protein